MYFFLVIIKFLSNKVFAILLSPYQCMRVSVFLVASIVYSVKVLIFFLNLIGEKYFFLNLYFSY